MNNALSIAACLSVGFVIGVSIYDEASPPDHRPHVVIGSSCTETQPRFGSSGDTLSATLRSADIDQLPALIEDHADDPSSYRYIAKYWAGKDPRGMARFTRSLPTLKSDQDLLFRRDLESVIYQVWARTDAEEAFQSALNNQHGNGQYNGITDVVAVVAEQNMDRGLAMVAEAGDRLNGYGPGPWLSEDPEKILPKIMALPECPWQGLATDSIFEHWATTEPIRALSFYIANGFDPSDHIGVRLANAAVESDAEATIQWAESLSESQHSLLNQTLGTALLGEGHGAPSRIRLDDSETLREEGAESAADIPYFLQRPD